jgi:hypothetical protein
VPDARDAFEQISASHVNPRFVRTSLSLADGAARGVGGVDEYETTTTNVGDRDGPSGDFMDVTPVAGTFVLFDSITLPHLVMEVTGTKQRIAATGWFHQDSQFVLEV